MQSVEVKKTYTKDFDKIYPLLKQFNSSYTRDNWYKIFSYKWDGSEDFIGFHLEYMRQPVGFMGLIFSCRYREDKIFKFCNITSLIVKEDHRSATILLIRQLIKLNNVIFTGLSPIEESYRLLSKLGFSDYENKYVIIPVINGLFVKHSGINQYELLELHDKLKDEEKRIVTDHANLNCNFIFFDINGCICLLIYKITRQKHSHITINKLHILHISHPLLFNKEIKSILYNFYEKYGFFSALYVDCRYVNRKNIFSIKRSMKFPRICKGLISNTVDIDELYSEAVLL